MTEVSMILSALASGKQDVAEKLLPVLYDELRKLAAFKLSKEPPGTTMQPTVLVHEAYIRLVDADSAKKWNGRSHFFGAAAEAMRRILVENARRKLCQKHGGEMQRIDLDIDTISIAEPHKNLLALDEVLAQFESQWPDKAKVVKLKYFAGQTIQEVSETLGISTATAERHWKFARAWLHSQLKDGEQG